VFRDPDGMAKPTNALIVDDEPHVRAFMRVLLKQAGITDAWEAAMAPRRSRWSRSTFRNS
jgi:DNA-binding response OmpR family regulator